jgi:hypothetical protein
MSTSSRYFKSDGDTWVTKSDLDFDLIGPSGNTHTRSLKAGARFTKVANEENRFVLTGETTHPGDSGIHFSSVSAPVRPRDVWSDIYDTYEYNASVDIPDPESYFSGQ